MTQSLQEMPLAGQGEFARGWPIIVASLVGIGCGLAALPFYTIGVFAPHLAREFGWSMGQIMAGLMITTLSVMVAGPLAGMVADRIGVRKVVIGSSVAFGLAYLSMALLQGSLVQFYVTWGVIAFVGAGTLPITWTRTVNRWFDRRKGLALGLSMMGTGLFGILSKPLLASVIGAWGWRAGFAALGALPLVLTLPLALALFREPPRSMSAGAADRAHSDGLSRGEALRSWRFWVIAIALVPISFGLGGPVPNLEPILLDQGIAPATILSLTPLVGLASIVGRLVGGWLLDRAWAPLVAFVILGVPSISCWVLAHAGLDPAWAGAAIFMIGFALGIEYDVVAYLTARYFGLRAYTSIYGILYVFFATGAGFAPMVFGMIRDRQGDFSLALTLSAIILPLGSAMFLALGPYPRARPVMPGMH